MDGTTIWVYVLCSVTTGRYYIGHTNDVQRRLVQHNGSHTKSTRGRGPYVLVHSEEFPNRAAAVGRERYLKSLKNRVALEQAMARASR